MRWRHVVAITLIFCVIVPVQARSFGEVLFGSDPKLRQAPYNAIEIGLLYRDTVEPVPYPEPMIYHLQERDGISSVIPDISMPVPITDRPVIAVVGGLVMTGNKIGKIYPAADIPIRVIVDSFNGWEDQGEWLYEAIKKARSCAGLEQDLSRLPSSDRRKARELERLERHRRGEICRSDPGAFPPFICLPKESEPKLNGDGSIGFGKPQLSLPLMIVAPVSNLILGSAHSISLLVSVNKNSYAGAVVGFKTARPDTFMVPNPALSQPRTEAAPPASPLAQENELPDPMPKATMTVNATAQASASVTATDQRDPLDGCPDALRRYFFNEVTLRQGQTWRDPDVLPSPWDGWRNRPGWTVYVYSCLILPDGSLLDNSNARVYINGQPHNCPFGARPSVPLCDKERPSRNGVLVVYAPPNANVRIEYQYGGQSYNAEFTTGGDGTIAYVPVSCSAAKE